MRTSSASRAAARLAVHRGQVGRGDVHLRRPEPGHPPGRRTGEPGARPARPPIARRRTASPWPVRRPIVPPGPPASSSGRREATGGVRPRTGGAAYAAAHGPFRTPPPAAAPPRRGGQPEGAVPVRLRPPLQALPRLRLRPAGAPAVRGPDRRAGLGGDARARAGGDGDPADDGRPGRDPGQRAARRHPGAGPGQRRDPARPAAGDVVRRRQPRPGDGAGRGAAGPGRRPGRPGPDRRRRLGRPPAAGAAGPRAPRSRSPCTTTSTSGWRARPSTPPPRPGCSTPTRWSCPPCGWPAWRPPTGAGPSTDRAHVRWARPEPEEPLLDALGPALGRRAADPGGGHPLRRGLPRARPRRPGLGRAGRDPGRGVGRPGRRAAVAAGVGADRSPTR